MPNNTSAQAASLSQVRPVWINSTVVLLELRRKFRNLRVFILAILLPVMFFFMLAYPQRDSLEGGGEYRDLLYDRDQRLCCYCL